MSLLPFPPNNVTEAIALIDQDAEILHNIVHGDSDATILTDNGLVPSVNNVLSNIVDGVVPYVYPIVIAAYNSVSVTDRPNKVVQVNIAGGGSANIYSDEGKTVLIPQDGIANVTDINGMFNFYANGGALEVTVSGITKTITTVNSASISNLDHYPIYSDDYIGQDIIAALPAILAQHPAVVLLGEFTAESVYPSNLTSVSIRGIRGQTKINVSGITSGTIFNLSNDAAIRGITFVGDLATAPDVYDGTTYAAEPNVPTVTFTDSVDQVIAMKGAGSLSAVNVLSTTAQVEYCEFTRFSFFSATTSQNLNDAVDSTIRHCRMYQNFGGIYQKERSEYMAFSDNNIAYNIYGVYKRGGNNVYCNNHIDHNRINFVSTSGLNDSHGSITGGTLNHGKLGSLVINDTVNGEAITGVNMYDCGKLGIYLRRSVGANISACLLGQVNVYCEGINTAQVGFPGVNTLSYNAFNLHGGTYKVYRHFNPVTGLQDSTQPDNCRLRDNFMQEGQASRDGSGWDEEIVNDTDVADADGWISHNTVLGGGNSTRIVSGRPIDGAKVIGSSAGAIKIVLPPSTLDNNVIDFDILITTSDGAGATLRFSAYALSDGSWLYYNDRGSAGKRYKIRFGAEAGKWVIYIGELADYFNNCVVTIRNISVHLGNLQYSRLWKRGWSISQEASAFSSVTLSTPDAALLDVGQIYNGDLNTVAITSEIYAYGGTNQPAGETGGWCSTKVAKANSDIRWQTYHGEGASNKFFCRTTTTGDSGYGAWVEK